MKTLIITFVVTLLVQTNLAQGIMYLSNLGQPSTGSLTVGSDSWMAALFATGSNAGGYSLDSIQLGMMDASGNPSNFTVMLYTAINGTATFPGSSLGTLDGSLNPATGGVYTFTTASNLILSPRTGYFIVLTAGTTIADGAYEWSYVTANSYNPGGGWSFPLNGILSSSNGSLWSHQLVSYFPQFAIDATAIPEPGVLGLLSLSGLAFLWHRRKAKVV